MADSGTIEISGLEERIKQLQELKTTNPAMEQRIRKVIREVIRKVRNTLTREAKSGLGMSEDPRQAYKAVRSAVYRRLFGGQVNILQSRKAGAMHFYAPPRKGTSDPRGRGGNRVTRQDRTIALMSYQGKDRGFVLRFQNQGTDNRFIRSMGGHDLKKGRGSRGNIKARNWFGNRSHQEMENAAANLEKMIDDIIQGIMY